MAEPKNDDFLDDITEAEAEELSAQTEEFDDVALELDSLRAERDELKDRFMRALADAENARKRSEKDSCEKDAEDKTWEERGQEVPDRRPMDWNSRVAAHQKRLVQVRWTHRQQHISPAASSSTHTVPPQTPAIATPLGRAATPTRSCPKLSSISAK